MIDFVQPLSDEFENIFFIQGQRNGRYPYSHSLLINDYLIDTGISSGFLRKLKRQFTINNVLLSHWHEDHISGNRLLPNAKFFGHIEDKPIIEDVQKMYEYYFISDKPDQIEAFNTILEGLRLKNTKINYLIEDNEILDVGVGFQLKVIHTPGHSRGHCCFLELNSKIAFLGDIDLSSFIWYGAKDSSVIALEESIDKLLQLDIEIAVTCHKGVISGGGHVKDALKEYKQIILDRDEQILSELSEVNPKSAKDLVNKNIIYKYYSEWESYEILAEEIMIQYHLNKLVKNEIIELTKKGYILT